MNIDCPRCAAGFTASQDQVLAADGVARCSQCDALFDVMDGRLLGGDADRRTALDLVELRPGDDAAEPIPEDLPFEVPDDLPPLEVSPDAALGIEQTLADKPRPLRWFATTLVLLLALALGVQFAWRYRTDLLQQYPQLAVLCDHIDCDLPKTGGAESFEVVQRDITPTPHTPGSLTLRISFGNTADRPLPYPDIQLSLLDNAGKTLIRRRLKPREYLFPYPGDDRAIAPGEVVTIAIDFLDPGYLATGFEIRFI